VLFCAVLLLVTSEPGFLTRIARPSQGAFFQSLEETPFFFPKFGKRAATLFHGLETAEIAA
jgi:hypothetical protein